MWSEEIGLTPTRSIAIDLLHTYHIGSLLVWTREALWAMVNSGSWSAGQTNRDEQIQVAVGALKAELFHFYSVYDQEHPGEPITRVSKFTPKKLGTSEKHKLRFKAMETWGLALFVLQTLEKRYHVVGAQGSRFLACGRHLLTFAHDLKILVPTFQRCSKTNS